MIRILLIIISIITISVFGYLIYIQRITIPGLAQAAESTYEQCTASDPGTAEATGLITASEGVSGFRTTAGVCITNSQAGFTSYRIPSFDSLKATFYDKAQAANKIPVSATATTLPTDFNAIVGNSGVAYYAGNLTVSNGNIPCGTINPPGCNKTVVVFVNGNLTFNDSFRYNPGDSAGGMVFIVRGDINIARASVTEITAVLISYGQICTLLNSDGTCPSGVVNPPLPQNQKLTIYGSLISLSADPTKNIKFRRTLLNNTQAAELIQQQPKYLVLLKNIFSETLYVTEEQ
jgi:hypothetical protein